MRYYTIITDKGFAKEQQAKIEWGSVRLSHIALGDAEEYEPETNQTVLHHEVHRMPISRIYKDEANENAVIIEGVLPEDVGGFMITEVGIYDEDGDLFAVAKYPETYKPVLTDGSTKDLYMRFILAFSNVPAVTLYINPNIAAPSIDTIRTLILEKLLSYALKDLSNLTDAGKALFNAKADASLANLNAAGQAKFTAKTDTSAGNLTASGKKLLLSHMSMDTSRTVTGIPHPYMAPTHGWYGFRATNTNGTFWIVIDNIVVSAINAYGSSFGELIFLRQGQTIKLSNTEAGTGTLPTLQRAWFTPCLGA